MNAPDSSSAQTDGKRALKVGVIGPGTIAGERLVPALSRSPGAIFWSVCGRDAARTAEFAAKHAAQSPNPAYTAIDAFLADPDLAAVVIASPDKLHAQQAIACAAAGKHVFIEKPMATTSEDANAIVRACADARVALAVGYHLRFHQGHRAVAELIAQGRIGRILHANLTWTLLAKETDWRAQDALGRWWSLGALGTHALDLARWLMSPSCGEISKSQAVLSNSVFGGPHDETALVSLAFQSGATAQVLSSVVFKAPRVVEIFGTEGTIRCVDTLGPRGSGKITINGEELQFPITDSYEGELSDFVTSALNGTPPSVGGDVGLFNVTLLEKLTLATACPKGRATNE
jgi:1,5-anhydro-D-fructose reductase (1,5-anhydro-D-mannitol-forming)